MTDVTDVAQETLADLTEPRLWLIEDGHAQRHAMCDLNTLLARESGVVWVDVPTADHPAVHDLADVFALLPRAVQDCAKRNPLPKVRAHPDHFFLVLHAPERGERGHVHYLELDQFIGHRFLITVHGPINPRLDPRSALNETDEVSRALTAGELQPKSVAELCAAIVTGIVRRLQYQLESLTTDVWDQERLVTGGKVKDPEELLEEMYRVRHGLLAVATMALLNHEVLDRLNTLHGFADCDNGRALLTDLVDQLHHLSKLVDAQRTYHEGVIAFYTARTNTKMAVAGERLAVIAGITLPVTAISGVMGMNVIVSQQTEWGSLWALLVLMAAVSVAMLVWARRQGWW